MRTIIGLRLLPYLTLVLLALISLPSADTATHAAPQALLPECPPTLAYKSCLGLMPPAHSPDPHAPALRSVSDASELPFLKPAASTATGSWPQVLAAADRAGAGRADAAVFTERYFDPANDRQIQVFSMQSGTFARAQQLPAGANPEAAIAMDTNLDGRPDLVVALAGENTLAVYRPGVTQPFSEAQRLPAPGAPDALASGDFDGDLRPDLAVATPLSDTIRLWRSNPQGLVPLPLELPFSTDGYDGLAVGDFNDDGQDDLAALRGAGYQANSVVVFLQDHGTFPTNYTLSPETGGYLPNSLAAGDLNGDGLDDLAVTSGGNMPSAYLNVYLQGAGGLAPAPITNAFHLPSAVAIGDINHDGRDDVVIVHDAWRTLSVYAQNDDATLAPYVSADIPYSSRYRPNALALADFDGDGGLDAGLVGRDAGLTLLANTIPAPTAVISQPLEAATLAPGVITIAGTAGTSAAQVQVRVRGLTDWADASLAGGVWRIDLTLPTQSRAWRIEARAIDVQGHVQAPPAHRRVGAETFCYVLADKGSVTDASDRLLAIGMSNAQMTLVGDTSTQRIEALAFRPGTPLLYGVEVSELGVFDLVSGLFTRISEDPFSQGHGAMGLMTFNNIDGLAFDPTTGSLYGVQRRPSDDDQDVLFQINPDTGKLIPHAFGSGTDYVSISGTGVPNDIDDLAFDPVSGTLYGVGNSGDDSSSVLMTIDKQTGAATVVGSLGVEDMEGLTYTTDGRLYGTTGDKGDSTRNRLYAIDKATGVATVVGPLEGQRDYEDQRDYEGIACPLGQVVLPAPDMSAVLPYIDDFTIDGQSASTSAQEVALQVHASGSASDGALWMLFVEYQYDPETGEWSQVQPASVRSSDWLAYLATPSQYTWQLGPKAGVKYLQAWAADSTGQLARLPYQTFINYIPALDSLARDERRIYRYTLREGERVTVRVASSNGDADLYVWSPDPDAPPSVSNLNLGTDEVSIEAATEGIYQVEVHGYTAATYRLTVEVTPDAAATHAREQTGAVNPYKPLLSHPLVPLDSGPNIRQAAPVGPLGNSVVYLPLLSR